jgi:hypothetical protein
VTRRALWALLLVVMLGAATLAAGRTEAAFNSAAGNEDSSYSVAPDFVAPSVTRTRVADPGNGPSYAARRCRFYYAYAEVTDTGSPASGVASVVANLTDLTAGLGADSLIAGSYSLDGLSYGYRSLPRLTAATAGSYLYDLTSTDIAGNSRVGVDYPATVAANGAAVSAVFLTGLEQGVASTTALGVFTTVTGSGVSADAANRRNGSYSLRTAPANAAAYAAVTLSGSGNTIVARFALRLASLPAATVNLAVVVPSVGNSGFLAYNSATGRLGVRWGAGSIVDATLAPAAGTWYVIELRAVTTSPRTLAWRIDGVDQTQASSTETAGNVTGIGFGTTATNVTYTANFDDVIASRTSSDYPIGNGKVLALAPNGMGTHLNPTRFQDNDSTAVDSTSWTRVDEVPANSTADYVKQITIGTTSYLEFTFADTTENCINAVGAAVAYHSSAAGTNSGKTSIFNGATENIVYSGSMGGTTLTYKRASVSAGAGAWTTALLNALVARVGYSGTVFPMPYWDALLLEYDVPINW